MRLDARSQYFQGPWQCLHVPTAQLVPLVVWADDESHQWGVRAGPRSVLVLTKQAKRIRILAGVRMVLIDPLDDVDEEVRRSAFRALESAIRKGEVRLPTDPRTWRP